MVREGDIVPTRNACVATVSQLIKSHTDDHEIFRKIQNLEFKTSACVSFRNHVMAIGGWKFNTETGQQKGTKLVHVYHTGENAWKKLECQLSRPRCLGFAAAFEDKIMTVGGYNRPNGICTDSVEFGILPSDEPKQVCQAPLPSEREAGIQEALVSDPLLNRLRERKVHVVCVRCVWCVCEQCVCVCVCVWGGGQGGCVRQLYVFLQSLINIYFS